MIFIELKFAVRSSELATSRVASTIKNAAAKIGVTARVIELDGVVSASLTGNISEWRYTAIEKMADDLGEIPSVQSGEMRDSGDRQAVVYFGKDLAEIENHFRKSRKAVMDSVEKNFPMLSDEAKEAILANLYV